MTQSSMKEHQMTYRIAILQRIADPEQKAYADEHISFAAVRRMFGTDKAGAVEYVAHQARMMLAVDLADGPFYDALQAGVSPIFDMRARKWK